MFAPAMSLIEALLVIKGPGAKDVPTKLEVDAVHLQKSTRPRLARKHRGREAGGIPSIGCAAERQSRLKKTT